jgi:hypothetical protein
MPKVRTPIPQDIAAEVLFRSDRTCCVCQTRGKRVQIHHLDDDPSNHAESNLAVLCLECHDETQIRGGFGRTLLAPQVARYKQDWEIRVAERRAKADQLVLQNQVGATLDEISASPTQAANWSPPPVLALVAYVESLPTIMKQAYTLAMPDWDTGATNRQRPRRL